MLLQLSEERDKIKRESAGWTPDERKKLTTSADIVLHDRRGKTYATESTELYSTMQELFLDSPLGYIIPLKLCELSVTKMLFELHSMFTNSTESATFGDDGGGGGGEVVVSLTNHFRKYISR